MDLIGNRNTGQMGTQGTVRKILTDLSGLPDDENCIEVILYTAEVQETETETGFGLNDTIEKNAQNILEAMEQIEATRKPYLSFTIDLNAALAQMDW